MCQPSSATWGGFVFTIVALLSAGFIGFMLGGIVEQQSWEDQAIDRGYAEWAKPQGGRGETVFQWIELEEEEEVTSDE